MGAYVVDEEPARHKLLLARLVRVLVELVREADAVGCAAPQVPLDDEWLAGEGRTSLALLGRDWLLGRT